MVSNGLPVRGLLVTPAPEVEVAGRRNPHCSFIGVEGNRGFIGGPSKVACTGGNQGSMIIPESCILACSATFIRRPEILQPTMLGMHKSR